MNTRLSRSLAALIASLFALAASKLPAAGSEKLFPLKHLEAGKLAAAFATDDAPDGRRLAARRQGLVRGAVDETFRRLRAAPHAVGQPPQPRPQVYVQLAQALPGEGGPGDFAELLPEGMKPPLAAPNENALLVRGTVEQLDEFAELLSLLDKPVPLVNTRVDLVDTPTRDVEQSGIDFFAGDGSTRAAILGQPGGNAQFGFATGTAQAFAAAGLTGSRSTVVNSANVTTQSGSPAVIGLARVTPFFVPFVTVSAFGRRTVDYQPNAVFTGVELFVRPRVHGRDLITVLVRPTFIDTVGSVTSPTGGTSIPITTEVGTVAEITVRSGQTICLGGFFRSREDVTQTPAGAVRTRETSTALLYLTPRIVRTLTGSR